MTVGDAYLARHPEKAMEFVDSIPPEFSEESARVGGGSTGAIVGSALRAFLGPYGILIGAFAAATGGDNAAARAVDAAIEESDASRLARHMCAD